MSVVNKNRNSCPHGVCYSSVRIGNTSDNEGKYHVYEMVVSIKEEFKAREEIENVCGDWMGYKWSELTLVCVCVSLWYWGLTPGPSHWAGLKLWSSCSPSQSAGIVGMCHHAWFDLMSQGGYSSWCVKQGDKGRTGEVKILKSRRDDDR